MKVLLLATHLNTGGVGVYTVNLARYLKREGVDVAVASSGGNLVSILDENNISHFTIDIKTKFEFSAKVWKTIPVIIDLVKNNGFQVLHAQTRVTQVLGYLSGKIAHVPFISTCHGFFKHRRLSRKFFPCWGEKAIAISKSVREHLLNDFGLSPENVELVYNGIDLDQFLLKTDSKDYNLMRDIGLKEDSFAVGALGRLSSVKGFKYLISAFKEAAAQDARMQLVILGDGPEKDALEKQISKLGIRDKVLLTSKNVPLEKYLSLLDIFCQPSIHEGLGLSLMEAMASGRACIASNVGGLSELIADGKDGILVPSENSKALAEAILRLAGSSELRRQMAKNALKKAADNFSIENSVKGTIKVYEKVIL